MDAKISTPIGQSLPIQEQGTSPLVVSKAAEGKIVRIQRNKYMRRTLKSQRFFWEWRHKIMTHFFAGMAALIALIGWLYQQAGGIRIWLCAPLFLGAVFSLVSYLLDKRNKRILERCYRIGKDVDKNSHEEGGIFQLP